MDRVTAQEQYEQEAEKEEFRRWQRRMHPEDDMSELSIEEWSVGTFTSHHSEDEHVTLAEAGASVLDSGRGGPWGWALPKER